MRGVCVAAILSCRFETCTQGGQPKPDAEADRVLVVEVGRGRDLDALRGIAKVGDDLRATRMNVHRDGIDELVMLRSQRNMP